jgi:phosphoadenosine phosphosulfate reductase
LVLLSPNLESAPPEEILGSAIAACGNRFAISTSFQAEGMVLVDMAARISSGVRVFTLDTGRLPAETYEMIEAVRSRYGIEIEIVAPDAAEIESMTTRHGPNLFYREPSLRMLCCHIRKVRPLDRKLATLDAWAVGLRREQSESRAAVRKVDLDARPVKLSPLADWSRDQIQQYIAAHSVPRHPLYARGYTSIGCAPCTRAVAPGEAERAGRWWWEQDVDKECGIHFNPDGAPVRTLDVLIDQIVGGTRA